MLRFGLMSTIKFRMSVSKWNIVVAFIILLAWCFSAQARLASSFRMNNLGFVSEDFSNTQSSRFSMLGVQIKSVDSENDFLKANLGGAYAFGSPHLSYLNVRELFIHTPLTTDKFRRSQFIIGRRIVDWSEMDSTWNLGLLQPQFRWNPVNPTTQGLVGFFWQLKSDLWGFTVFGSPVFIPDQSASYELKNGEFQKSSPWFGTPPRHAQFGTDSLPIQYQISAPPLSDILYQPSYGAQFQLGKEKGAYLQVASLYKPSNQIALTYQATVNPDPAVQVEIVPKSYFEHITSADFGYRFENTTASASVVLNRPEQIESPSEYTKPILENAELFGAQVSHAFQMKSTQLNVSLAHLQMTGDRIQDSGPDASEQRATLSPKYFLENAVQATVDLKFRLTRNLQWFSQASWMQSYIGDYKLLRIQNRFDFRGPWAITAELFFVESTSIFNPGYAIRDLDQLWLGVSYDF